MVGYLPIADEEVQPGAPLLSSLGVRLRDNPRAIAEGWQDAPNVLRKRIRLFTSSGTWEKPAQIRCVEVHVMGGGGGAGGSVSSDSSGQGGGGGGYAMKVIDRDDLGSSVSVTVGQGGQGGDRTSTSSASDGQNGGTSSFGSHVSATGGGGGERSGVEASAGSAGTGSGGDMMVRGYPGNGSAGGGSGGPYGTARNTGSRNAPTSQTYGVGGTGLGETGGNGSRGMVLVIEYLGGEEDA